MLKRFDTARVAVLCSSRAPGLDEIVHHPNRGKLFDVVCAITTDGFEYRGDVPVVQHPIHQFVVSRGAHIRDLGMRREYDRVTVDLLHHLGIDTVVLLGYLYVITEPLLSAFPDRILNVHDSDLTLTHADGRRRYTGLHATRDTIVAGERETRSTLHLVTEELDGGPVVTLSRAYEVAPFVHDAVNARATNVVKAYAYAQREWMMRDAWGGMVVNALETIAAGEELVPSSIAS